MVISLAVLLIPIVAITLFFTQRVPGPPVQVVDWKPVLAQAREQANFPIWAPTELPNGWRPTQVSWVQRGNPDLTGNPVPADRWQFGTLNAQDVYLGIDEQAGGGADFVATASRNGVADGQSVIGANTWQRLVTNDRQQTRSLVLTTKQATTVVSGDVPYDQLEAFVRTLTAS